MTTDTTTTAMNAAQLAGLVTEHLVEHGLPEPFSVYLCADGGHGAEARIQVHGSGLAGVTAELLAWATTLSAVSLRAWRPPDSHSVHLDVQATLTGPDGSAALTIYGGVPFDAELFPGLEPGESRPISLGQLTSWATDAATGVAV